MCPYLFKLRGKFAHDAACDVRHDNGMSMPWYWERTSGEFGQGFHSEDFKWAQTELAKKGINDKPAKGALKAPADAPQRTE